MSLEIEKERPQYLNQLLGLNRSKQDVCDKDYKRFLGYAKKAQEECQKSNIPIRASFETAVPKQGIDAGGRNDSLHNIYNYYVKHRRPIHTRIRVTDPDKLKFSKLELFCQDFNIVPRLITRDDLKRLWRMLGDDTERGILKSLSFDDFKDYLVRMAIYTFNKPGLRKLVVTIEGFLPKKENLVECLCNYLHLHDIDHVRNQIRMVERNTDTGGELSQPSTVPSQGSYDRDNGPIRKEDFAEKSGLLVSSQSKMEQMKDSMQQSQSLTRMSIYKDRYPLGKPRDPIITSPANPTRVIRPDYEAALQQEEEDRNNSMLPELLRRTLIPPNVTMVSISNDGLPMGGDPTGYNHDPDDDSRFDNNNMLGADDKFDTMSRASFASSVFSHHDNRDEMLMQSFRNDYDPSLIRLLDPFCYIPPKPIAKELMETGGPYIDLGLQAATTQVVIKLFVTNSTPDDLQLDATTRNFMSEDTDMLTYSALIPSGITRKVTITFTVEPGRKDVVGFIDVFALAARNARSQVISCPVFYRVDPTISMDNNPRCTVKTLPHMILQETKRVGTPKDKLPEVSFETKRLSNGTWKSGSVVFNSKAASTATKVYTVHR